MDKGDLLIFKSRGIAQKPPIPEPEDKEEAEVHVLPRNLTKTQCIDAAKGMKCINHPWRDAYALCNYCKMPFCYAETVEGKGSYYCANDIGKVQEEMEVNASYAASHILIRVSAMLMLLALAIWAYSIYPQIIFLYNNEAISGMVMSLFHSIGYSSLYVVNAALIVIAALLTLALLVLPDRVVKAVEAAGIILLVISAYEYYISPVSYLLIANLVILISIFAAFVGSSLLGTAKYKDGFSMAARQQLVRIETFG